MSRWSPKPAPDWPEGLILFDGVCVFCSRWVRAVIARDHARRFRFASVQSPYGRAAALAFGIDPEAPETNAAVVEGEARLKSDSAIAILERLPGGSWARALRVVPKPLRDAVYDLIARNRYSLFGKTEACFVPSAQDRERFLDGAPPPDARAPHRHMSSRPMSR